MIGDDPKDFILPVGLALIGLIIWFYNTRIVVRNKGVINESLEFLEKHRPTRGAYVPKESVFKK